MAIGIVVPPRHFAPCGQDKQGDIAPKEVPDEKKPGGHKERSLTANDVEDDKMFL
jgi:hypothetical protein